MRNVEETMAVGNEDANKSQRKAPPKGNWKEKKKFKNWIWSILISFLPILALPVWELISNGNISTMLYTLFCDSSVIFVGISFTITAMNDFVEYRKIGEYSINPNFFLLILGTIFYVVIIIRKDVGLTVDMNVVFGVNLGYFIIMFLLGASKYIGTIREAA